MSELWYHGTDEGSAVALLAGARLDREEVDRRHICGPVAFHLASVEHEAEFFALRRGRGAILKVEISDSARRELMAAGAIVRPIPGGRGAPYFNGKELVIPPEAFELFDDLRSKGEIVVAP